MIGALLLLIGLGSSNAQEPTITQLKTIAIENAVNGNTKLLDCIDKNSRKGDSWVVAVCKVGE